MPNGTDFTPPGSFSYAPFNEYVGQEALSLPPQQQDFCLNITDPPSIYSYSQYSALWQPAWCMLWNVTLSGRVDSQDNMNYCTVPLRGADGFVFLSLALLVSACCFGKLASVIVLCVGGILGTINYYSNLLQIGNAISIWLAIQPADLFFYAFIPPLVVEETMRIDLFLLRKGFVHVILLAYLLVALTIVALTPIILYALQFKNRGWSWVHAALFSAIIAPTDTVAVAAIMASSNAPSKLSTILRGESVFNDASGLTFFGIFTSILAANATPGSSSTWPSVWSTLPGILLDLLRTTAVGVAIGLAMSYATHKLLRLLRWRGASPYIDTTVVLAVSYLCYYVANSPAKASGVIAVVCFGLYGNATSKWGMLATVENTGSFDAVWDLVAFAVNGLVFFWSGVAAVNFLIRSAGLLTRTPASFIAIPVIWVAMILIRVVCIVLFNPIFKFFGQGFTPSEIIFSGFASMRGAVSLIMASGFAVGSSSIYTGSDGNSSDGNDDATAINAEILLWTASFVVITLVVNGSLCGPMLQILNLCTVSKERNRTRARAKRSLCEFTEEKLTALKQSKEAEFLAGANWDLVQQYVEVAPLEGFDVKENETDEKIESYSPSAAAAAARAKAEKIQTLLGVLATLGSAVLNYFKQYCSHIFSTVSTGSKYQIKRIKYKKGAGNSSFKNQPAPRSGGLVSPPATPATVIVQLSAPTPKVSEDSKHSQHLHSSRDETSHRSGGWSDNSGAFEEMDWTQEERIKECPFLAVPKESKTDASEEQKTPPLQPLIDTHLDGDIESNFDQDEFEHRRRRKTVQPTSTTSTTSTTSAGLKLFNYEIEEASTQSMPAAIGRGMRAALQKELGTRAGTTSVATEEVQPVEDAVSSALIDDDKNTLVTGSEIPCLEPPSSGVLHGATVSGASGVALAAELKRQLNLGNGDPTSTSLSYTTTRSSIYNTSRRDLLGRKASGSASPRPLQFLGFGVTASSPSFSGGGIGGGGFGTSGSGDTSIHGNSLTRTSVFSGRDRAVLPAASPLAAALLDQRLGALQHRQQQEQQQHKNNAECISDNSKNSASFSTIPPTEEVLYEEKSRVVSGLKRHFTARRLAGLLSTRGLRLLEYSCDEILDNNGSLLRLWPLLEAEVRGGWAARGASRLSLVTLGAYRSMPRIFHKLFSWPLKKTSTILRRYLGRKMLVACEVAVELYLALTSIPQVAWLKQEEHGSTWRCLLEDIELDTVAAHHFIIQREIEAPDMFQAIASFRSAMAVLRQQLSFCQNLFENGAIDASELQGLCSPIDRKIRHLEMVGPVWRPPRAKAVLRSLSLVSTLSDEAFRRFYAAGSILGFRNGQLIWDSSSSSSTCPGLYIILSGVVKRVLKTHSITKEYFQGPGGVVVGSIWATDASTFISCIETVVAEGNALGRGPVVFHLPRAALEQMVLLAEFAGLQEELKRLASEFDEWLQELGREEQ